MLDNIARFFDMLSMFAVEISIAQDEGLKHYDLSCISVLAFAYLYNIEFA